MVDLNAPILALEAHAPALQQPLQPPAAEVVADQHAEHFMEAQQAHHFISVQNIVAPEPPMQQVNAFVAEPDFLDAVDLSFQKQEIDRQLLAKEMLDEFANPSFNPMVQFRENLMVAGKKQDALPTSDENISKQNQVVETADTEKEPIPGYVENPIIHNEVLDTLLADHTAVPYESAACASLGPPPGYDTKGKYLPTKDISSSLAPDISDPYLQTMIHGASMDSKVVKSPQEDHLCLGGESVKLQVAHFAPKNDT